MSKATINQDVLNAIERLVAVRERLHAIHADDGNWELRKQIERLVTMVVVETTEDHAQHTTSTSTSTASAWTASQLANMTS